VLSADTLSYGREAALAILGVDALYRGESGDDVGLAVLNMDTAGELAAAPLHSYEDARKLFESLRAESAALPEPDRRVYYDQLCHSTLAFIAWRTGRTGFEAQLADFLHVPAEPASDQELADLRARIHGLLTGMGYEGDVTRQCAAWEERNCVPASDVQSVLQGLMDRAWDRTCETLIDIPADKSDGMRVSVVNGMPFNARCDYLRRTVEVNADPVLTLPGLKHLAVHEGYPGHYLQFKLRETLYREGRAPADVLLSVVNTASSSVFEGIADAGMEMLGWGEDTDDRVQSLLNRHRAGIGTGAAWRLHALDWSPGKVGDWLHQQCLVGGEGWVTNRMAFIGAPSRAVLIWSYWWGEPSVLPVWRSVPPERRQEFLLYLHGRMHSTRTVAMFNDGGS
jgi:hypothetical protein